MVENQLGRSTFLYLCGGIILSVPLILTLYSLAGGNPSIYFGSQILSLCIFSSFCVIYPNLPTMLLQIPIKWMGLFFLAASLLGALQAGAFGQLIAIIIAVSFSLIIVQSKGKAVIKIFSDSWTQPTSSKPKTSRKSTKKPLPKPKLKPKTKIKSSSEVDDILDKISEHGIHSLTDEERQTLQEARK